MPRVPSECFLTHRRSVIITSVESTRDSISAKLFKKSKSYPSFPLRWSLAAVLILVLSLCTHVLSWDPYEVLSVSRDASLTQIKRAYRDLAVKYHPDKNNHNDDDSGKKFIELNKAFDILKSPEKRSRYDQFGDLNESQPNHPYRGDSRGRTPQGTWNSHAYRTYRYFDLSLESLKKKSLTTRQYYDRVRESKFRPFLIFFYANFCKTCKLFTSTWTKITNELAKNNISSFTIDVQREYHLSNELGVDSIPLVACLVDGQLRPYYNNELSLGNIVKFIRSILPNDLFISLQKTDDQDRFIKSGPQHNRLSAVLITNEPKFRLRYHLMAYELRFHYRFGVIDTRNSDFRLFAEKYHIPTSSDLSRILVFDENYDHPRSDIKLEIESPDFKSIREDFARWPYLQLPRLSSQEQFDDLCIFRIPRDGHRTQQRLCVILFTSDTPSTYSQRKKLIEFISMNRLAQDPRVVFAYIDIYKQSEFIEALLHETRFQNDNETIKKSIILMERDITDRRKAHYSWLASKWNPYDVIELDKAKIELFGLIENHKNGVQVTKARLALIPLVDEESPGVISRVFWRFIDYISRATYYMTSQQSLASILAFLIIALMTSMFLYENPTKLDPNSSRDSSHSSTESIQDDSDELKLIELKAETYNGMVRLLKPGHRSIILLSDRESVSELLPQFKRALWPYRRNKTLLFGHLCLDKNIDWYRNVLQQVLGVEDLNLNKRKCIGTVLSLNGFRKYLMVYHAMHDEIHQLESDISEDEDGNFIGFDRQPLERLSLWLDKMFDGLTKRYSLREWPEEMK